MKSSGHQQRGSKLQSGGSLARTGISLVRFLEHAKFCVVVAVPANSTEAKGLEAHATFHTSADIVLVSLLVPFGYVRVCPCVGTRVQGTRGTTQGTRGTVEIQMTQGQV